MSTIVLTLEWWQAVLFVLGWTLGAAVGEVLTIKWLKRRRERNLSTKSDPRG